jgi:hypothetical protein
MLVQKVISKKLEGLGTLFSLAPLCSVGSAFPYMLYRDTKYRYLTGSVAEPDPELWASWILIWIQ